MKYFRRKDEDNPCSNQAREGREEKSGKDPDVAEIDQQISGAAEPCQEDGDRHGIEKTKT